MGNSASTPNLGEIKHFFDDAQVYKGSLRVIDAAGNEDKVGEARKMIIQGVIGLAVILVAWGIASFVINQLYGATAT